jgi:hypothetical protein
MGMKKSDSTGQLGSPRASSLPAVRRPKERPVKRPSSSPQEPMGKLMDGLGKENSKFGSRMVAVMQGRRPPSRTTLCCSQPGRVGE